MRTPFQLILVAGLLWMAQVAALAQPKVLSLPAENLAANKERYQQGNAEITAAVAALLKAADGALTKRALSVMDKPAVAASGDKHDYYSVAPYWWPNPSTKDGLPYIHKDGEFNTAERAKTDSIALTQTCDRVQLLGLAYFFSGQEKYAQKATELVRHWFLNEATRMNPNLQYSQAINGRVTGSSIGILEGLSFVDLLDGVALLASSPAWTSDDANALRSWFVRYDNWLHSSENGKGAALLTNNLGTWYVMQATAIALYLGETQRAHDLAQKGTERLLAIQIAADGSQPREMVRTKSFAYHVYNLQAWVKLAIVARAAGFDGWNYHTAQDQSVSKALAFLAPYANPEKSWIKKDIVAPNRTSLMPLFTLAAQYCKNPAPFEQALQWRPREEYPRWLLWSKMSE